MPSLLQIKLLRKLTQSVFTFAKAANIFLQELARLAVATLRSEPQEKEWYVQKRSGDYGYI